MKKSFLFAAALLLSAWPLAAQESFESVVTGAEPQVKIGQLELRSPSTPLKATSSSEQAGMLVSATGIIASGGNPFRYGTFKILDERVYQGGDADYSPLLWAAYVNPPSGAGNTVVGIINASGRAVRFWDDGSIEAAGLRDADGVVSVDPLGRSLRDMHGVERVNWAGGTLVITSPASLAGGNTVVNGTLNATQLAVAGSASVGGNLALSGTLTSGAVPSERLTGAIPPAWVAAATPGMTLPVIYGGTANLPAGAPDGTVLIVTTATAPGVTTPTASSAYIMFKLYNRWVRPDNYGVIPAQ